MQPLVSIIIPTFNYGHLISETLDSVFNQDYSNWECIIVDDGSKDNTRTIIQTKNGGDKRIRYVIQKNQGLSAARNTGINIARGEYIQFLDADDLISSSKIRSQVRFLSSEPNVDLVISGAIFFSPQSTWTHATELSHGSIKDPMNYFILDNQMVVSAPLIRRHVIRSIGYFDTDLTSLEDWDYWLRAVNQDVHMYFEPKRYGVTKIRVHEGSMKQNILRMKHNEIIIRLKHKELFPSSLNSELITDCLKYLAYAIYSHTQSQYAINICRELSLILPDVRIVIIRKLTWLPKCIGRRVVWLLFGDWKYIVG